MNVCPSRGFVDALLARMGMEARQAAQPKANQRKYLQVNSLDLAPYPG
nr:hypothetical protein [Actinoplanes polyasparticus]